MEVRYTFPGSVAVGVDLFTGRIFKLSARDAYHGSLLGKFYHLGMYPESLAAFRQILLLAPGEADAAREAYCHMAAVYREMGWPRSDIEKWLNEEAQASPDPLVRGGICQALEWVRQASA